MGCVPILDLVHDQYYDYILVDLKEDSMKPSESIKPISFVKSHASELIRDISKDQKIVVITQNGEAKAVLQDIHLFEQTQDSLALLKILAISRQKMDRGQFKPAQTALQSVRKRIRE